jgi:hypothetical protein
LRDSHGVRRVAACVFAVSVAVLVAVPSSHVSATAQGSAEQCNGQYFTQRVDALFGALRSGTPRRVAALFPNPETWKFHSDGAGYVVSEGGGVRIEPSEGSAADLLAAVQRRDVRTIARMFPDAGRWQLEVVPTLDGFIRDGSLSRSSSTATRDGGALAKLVDQFRGTTITWSAPDARRATATDFVSQNGTVYADQYLSGPLRWRVSRYPRGRGHTVVRGAAKLGMYCEGGVFGHVVMTPGQVMKAD